MIRHKKELAEFGATLKRIRLEKNLTQQDLAGFMDVDIRMIRYYETGTYNPTLNTIIGLAKALKIDIKELV